MNPNSILNSIHAFDELANFRAEKLIDVDLPRGSAAFAIAKILQADGENRQQNLASSLQVVVTASEYEAEELASFLKYFLPENAIAVFPAWETLPHERLSPRADTVARRLHVLRRLAHPEEFAPLKVVVMPVRALLQPIAANLGQIQPVRLSVGESVDLSRLQAALTNTAYTRVDMVESRGEFAVRGGIVDIFPPTEKHPLRVEFFGDEIDEIRTFAISDQRSLASVAELYAPPCREILLTDAVRSRAAKALTKLPGAAEMLEQIAAGVAVEGMESLAPILVDEMISVISELPEKSRMILIEPERIAAHAQSLAQTTAEFLAAAWSNAAAGGEIPVNVDTASFASLQSVRSAALDRSFSWWNFAALAGEDTLSFGLREPKNFGGDTEKAFADLAQKIHDGWQILLTADSSGLSKRLAEQLSLADVPNRMMTVCDIAKATETISETRIGAAENELEPSVVHLAVLPLKTGFVDERNKFAIISAHDILSRIRTRGIVNGKQAMPTRRKKAVDPLTLKPGDYVVHERHGVAQFVKLVKRQLGGASGTTREYMLLEYAASKRGGARDQLWVPTDQLYLVSKYSGGDAPSLNKMGGADWAKTKAKARAAVKEIARELIRLYAKRRATRGYAFSSDTPWQRELEDAFEYVETPDQLHTIEEVKRDMESLEPMDRLISGDVGYGKTEIAVRAAFKAIQDGKQVAVLVPTTLLVQQHLETFRERYAGFPARVEGLSRFQTRRESDAVKDGIAKGEIDVVIGTHRLITGEVRFKDLGLVIIDEEQRFGVEHKETLKQLYPQVDVLSMSATPIPRTLEMAVTGIRQMSTLATPPEERHPILTYVGVQDAKQVSAAIKRELLRDGQVFYIHNRTQSVNKTAASLAELVPEARVGVAHGKMSESQLELVIQKFWEKEIDVLVCTTIVETGLDISNANTLIVEDAQKLGLSQLHQLRGRVGRGRERAYAYFLYPPEKAMTETAIERLRTIAAHTELGAGIQVAMKDLEIRGAGNLLGGEQSGHIAGVGFDLYLRMVSEAVAKLTGQAAAENAAEQAEIRIELPVDAYVPQGWVSSERLRLEIYTKISAARTEAEREDIRHELVDRYGEIPPEVARLFRLSRLRELAVQVGVAEISLLGRNVRIAPVELSDFRQVRLKRLYPKALLKPAVRAILVPLPEAELGRISDSAEIYENEAIFEYVERFIHAILVAE
ncbi:transcription-repair coupling factor [Arcanobacterium hippocoleae]|uniref:Transcription-repair-coupling factor n=1 Tax=Arcanobacterium hippocoleae TaxID=149017 RepID=A0ABU1T1Q9_9ACTO|nr:transcription-repair coupling factor [Arcanobacterium hippocoleae]MDR6939317.1 transcription-repair coupling factor (superfamily II helicase) [Arcanobacterium hippocoleae]